MESKADSAVAARSAFEPWPAVLDDLLDAIPCGLIIFSTDLGIIRPNRHASRMFPGVRTVDALLTHGAPDSPTTNWTETLRSVLKAGRAVCYPDLPHTAPDGSPRLLHVTIAPLRDRSHGPVVGGLLVAEQAHSAAPAEAKAASSANAALDSVDAARLAHELNNPLDGVVRYVNLALRRLESASHQEIVGYLEESRRGLLRIVQIVRESKGAARGRPVRGPRTNVNRIVEEALRCMQDRASESGVVIAASYRDEKMPTLPGPGLFQVCCNIIKNALEAMPDGGRLTITTGIVRDQVLIRFEDTGLGLPEDVEKVFEPFYTTKRVSDSTGLGLAISRDIVRRLGGRITADRRPEGGSIFTVWLPLLIAVPLEGTDQAIGDDTSTSG